MALFGGLSIVACEPAAVVVLPSEMAAAPIPGANDMGSGDAGSGDTGSGDMGSGDMGSGDTGSGDTGSGDMGSGDMGSGDMGSRDMGSDDRQIAIQVTSNGWHTGIVVARALLPAGAIPEAADFPDAPYLGFGWGDADYYPAPRPTVGLLLRAALQPTPAVVHMAGLPAHPRQVFPNAEVIDLWLSAEGYRSLLAYLDGSFARVGRERIRSTAPGLYGFSLFYPATGEFHLFNTCNTWTARGLEQAGLPIRVLGTLRAEDLMAQVRQIAARRNRRRPVRRDRCQPGREIAFHRHATRQSNRRNLSSQPTQGR